MNASKKQIRIVTAGLMMFSEPEIQDRVVHYCSMFAEVINAGASTVDTLRGWILKDVEVFKAGTWRGVSYTEADLDDMVANFDTLKAGSRLDPVFKVNHSEDARDQVGWILSVKRSGELLLADIHVTEWEAYDKITNGTWKKVSAEIYLPELADQEFGLNSHVLRAVAVVSIPQVKDLKGIVLNAESWGQDPGAAAGGTKTEEGKKVDKWLQMLAEMLGVTVETLTEAQREQAVAMFGEYNTANPQHPQAQPGAAAGAVTVTAEQFVALAEKFTKLEADKGQLAGQVAELLKGGKKAENEKWFQALSEQGKVLPAEREKVLALAEKLDGESLAAYKETFEARPVLVELGERGSQHGQEPGTDPSEKTVQAFNEQYGQRTYN